jgi:two-component system, NtrC family, nitrogen regulation sensor histidine kinase NtrY
MLKSLSLKTKTFSLLLTVVLLATLPLIVYYNKTAGALSLLASDKDIERGLSQSIDLAKSEGDKATAVLAYKKYSQVQALKGSIVRQVFIFTMLYFIAVIAAAIGLGYVFISRITRPLRDLTLATQELARDNLEFEIASGAGGEIGLLQDSFIKMVADLKEARELRAIAERRAAWQHVARTLAHEIKNPLTPIKLSTERMVDKFQSNASDFPEVIQSTSATILTEIANLQKLLDTFHQYAKFPDPVLREECLNTLIRETLQLFDGEKVVIHQSLAPNLPKISVDKGQLRQALINLVKNALQALEGLSRAGRITVGTLLEKGRIQIYVEDNGCGISEENKKKLFQPYFSTKKHGSGIGLALTERIASLHGGKIHCDSRVGVGTIFRVFLPLDDKALGETRTKGEDYGPNTDHR